MLIKREGEIVRDDGQYVTDVILLHQARMLSRKLLGELIDYCPRQ